MGTLVGILFAIEAIISVLLIGIILVQRSKDEGLGLAFGAGVGETLFGSRAGNVLTKITIGLATAFLLITIWIGYLLSGAARSSSVTDRLPAAPAGQAQQQQVPAQPQLPAGAPSDVPAPAPTPAVPVAPTPSQGAAP